MRVLITGATGYLGTAMLEQVPAGIDVIATGFTRGHVPLDVTDALAVRNAIHQHRPDAVVHLAAVSMTGAAAADPERATAVNVAGARAVADATGGCDIRLVALSSDVIFDGEHAPYDEEALPRPVNPYGESKLAGERAIADAHPDPLIVRTSVLVGRNRADRYPFTMFVLQQARNGLPVKLFENERRNFYPVTSAAAAIWECAGATVTGILNIGATDSTSRFQFGKDLLIAAGLDPALAIPAAGPPERPSDLTLIVDRAREALATPMPTRDEVMVELRRDLHLT
ncbi:MAG: SDR family oxidoreductase [Acidimicrobiia bacterium]|nr:SDR family oxidoreductase [Acidimicrobiia bacterium]NNC92279.1 SDR family oxidoreductase [Acidimicrobiia bacterium]